MSKVKQVKNVPGSAMSKEALSADPLGAMS